MAEAKSVLRCGCCYEAGGVKLNFPERAFRAACPKTPGIQTRSAHATWRRAEDRTRYGADLAVRFTPDPHRRARVSDKPSRANFPRSSKASKFALRVSVLVVAPPTLRPLRGRQAARRRSAPCNPACGSRSQQAWQSPGSRENPWWEPSQASTRQQPSRVCSVRRGSRDG